MKKYQIVLSFLAIVSVTPSLYAQTLCETDCDAISRFPYPCPKYNDLGKMCNGLDPNKRLPCLSARKLACETWENMKNKTINKLGSKIAATESVQTSARKQGWTTSSCENIGAATITALSIAYGTAVCTAVGVSTLGTGITPCVTFLGASSVVIIGATCNQLCTDRHLADCK